MDTMSCSGDWVRHLGLQGTLGHHTASGLINTPDSHVLCRVAHATQQQVLRTLVRLRVIVYFVELVLYEYNLSTDLM